MRFFPLLVGGLVLAGCGFSQYMPREAARLHVEPAVADLALEARRQCDAGEPNGCLQLGLLYARGQGVTRDWAQAARYYELACDRGSAEGCSNLGGLYALGQGVVGSDTR